MRRPQYPLNTSLLRPSPLKNILLANFMNTIVHNESLTSAPPDIALNLPCTRIPRRQPARPVLPRQWNSVSKEDILTMALQESRDGVRPVFGQKIIAGEVVFEAATGVCVLHEAGGDHVAGGDGGAGGVVEGEEGKGGGGYSGGAGGDGWRG